MNLKKNLLFVVVVLLLIPSACAPIQLPQGEGRVVNPLGNVLDSSYAEIPSQVMDGKYSLWCYYHAPKSFYWKSELEFQGYQTKILYVLGENRVEVSIAKTKNDGGGLLVDARAYINLSDLALSDTYTLDDDTNRLEDLKAYVATLDLPGLTTQINSEAQTLLVNWGCADYIPADIQIQK